MIDPAILALTLSQTLFGQMFLVRFGLLLLVLAALVLVMRAKACWRCCPALALVLISVTSHAAAASPARFHRHRHRQ